MPFPPEHVTVEFVSTLIAEQVVEQSRLDYKRELPGDSSSARADFLADVASLANTDGGVILFGVEAERDANGKPTGAPAKVVGITELSVDAQILRLDSMIRDGIAPRISAIRYERVEHPDGDVFALRIPRSASSPHMITFEQRSRFYARGEAGKYPMDVHQVRDAFVRSEEQWHEVEAFRTERVQEALAFSGGRPLFILHTIPAGSLRRRESYELNVPDLNDLQPIYAGGSNYRRNFDGLFKYWAPRGEITSSVQVFRNGVVEAVDASMLGRGAEIATGGVAEHVISYFRTLRETYRRLGVEFPIYVLVTMCNIRDFSLQLASSMQAMNAHPFDRDHLLFPEILDDGSEPPAEALRPFFDLLWQAGGMSRCLHYDVEGKWQGGPG